jgi:hypothetical protein
MLCEDCPERSCYSGRQRWAPHDLYDCCPRAKDALFTTMDALITQTQARTLPIGALSRLKSKR